VPLRRSIFGFFFPAALILGVAATVLRSDAAPMLRSLHGFSVLVYAGAALVAWRFGVKAERRSLEEIAAPLSSV
jgi:hypothetical protein